MLAIRYGRRSLTHASDCSIHTGISHRYPPLVEDRNRSLRYSARIQKITKQALQQIDPLAAQGPHDRDCHDDVATSTTILFLSFFVYPKCGDSRFCTRYRGVLPSLAHFHTFHQSKQIWGCRALLEIKSFYGE